MTFLPKERKSIASGLLQGWLTCGGLRVGGGAARVIVGLMNSPWM